MRRVLVFAFLIGGIFLLVMTASMNLARQDEATTWLYFNDSGRFYRMQADGSDKTQIADVDFYYATWPKEGNWFVASGRRERGSEDFDLYRVDMLGRRLQLIARTENSDELMAWSPDGTGLVFASTDQLGAGRLYYSGVDGGGLRPIIPDIGNPEVLDWTADGWIVVVGMFQNQYGVFQVRADGSGLERLASDVSMTRWLNLTRDKKWLIFLGNSLDQAFELNIYRIRLDGSQLENLTPESGKNIETAIVDPHAEWIVYRARSTAGTTMGRMRLDGREDQVLVQEAALHLPLYMSAEWLYYVVSQPEARELYRMHLDGQDMAMIDDNVSMGYDRWSLDGRWFQFVRNTNDNTALEMVMYDTVENKTYPLHELVETAMVGTQRWSADSEWLYYRARHNDSRTFERIRPTGKDRQVLTTTEGEFHFVGEGPRIDLGSDANLLAILGLVLIGGSLCVGYWFLRD